MDNIIILTLTKDEFSAVLAAIKSNLGVERQSPDRTFLEQLYTKLQNQETTIILESDNHTNQP